jgi:integrase
VGSTSFLRQTGNIVLTARLLGHASIATTSRFYEHLNLEDLRQAQVEAGVVSKVIENRKKRKIGSAD